MENDIDHLEGKIDKNGNIEVRGVKKTEPFEWIIVFIWIFSVCKFIWKCKPIRYILIIAIAIALIVTIFDTIQQDEFHSSAQFTLLADNTYEVSSIGDYNGTDIVIQEKHDGLAVTSIGDNAFKDCKYITSITLPDSVTRIGNEAFSNCQSLTEIKLPASIKSIGNSAFYNCNKLTNITIPNNVTSIGVSAFSDCNSLTSINLPNTLMQISEKMFFSCDKLQSINISGNVKIIDSLAFADCSSLTSVSLPASIESIGENAFSRSALITINYGGTMAQWNAITKVEDCWNSIDGILDWDYYTEKYTIYCTDGTISKQ